MTFQLHCSRCAQDFRVPVDSPAAAVLERVAEDGPWCALGDGETFEDTVYTALSSQQSVSCPCCGGPVSASEDSLSQFSQTLLEQW